MSLDAIMRDMREVAQAHERWAFSPDATTSEAGASTAAAEQIRRRLALLQAEATALRARDEAHAQREQAIRREVWEEAARIDVELPDSLPRSLKDVWYDGANAYREALRQRAGGEQE